jgi:hypothetical protein
VIRINGTPVIEIQIHLPLNGAWSADLHCVEVVPFAIGSKVTISLPEKDFVGTVERCAVYATRVHIRVIGGAVDFGNSVSSKNYSNVSADALLSEMGIATDQPIGKTFACWSRIDSSIGVSVQLIAKQLGVNWRVNPDSTLRIRAEEFVSVNPDAVETYRDESGGMIELAIEKATVLPGTKVGNDLVGDTIYVLQEDGRLVCRYWTEGRGRLLERYIRAIMRDSIYLGTYPAIVAGQASDGALDLVPEDSRIKGTGLNKVKLKHGFPGCEVKVPNGQRVRLAFDNGDPEKPYASLWDQGTVTEVSIGGAFKVAIADLVKAELDKIQQKFDAHTHITACPAGAGSANPPVAHLIAFIGDVAAKILGTK